MIQLRSGLRIENPELHLEELLTRWYPVYDGVPIPHDNHIRPEEITLSVMLNSRISGNTGDAIWRQREKIQEYLAAIPTDIDLLEIQNIDQLGCMNSIAKTFDVFCGIRRVKLGIAAKILHKKRPLLLPILDSQVHNYYYRRCIKRWRKGMSYGEQVIELIKQCHADLRSQEQKFRELLNFCRNRNAPLSHVRILDYFLWKAGAEKPEL